MLRIRLSIIFPRTGRLSPAERAQLNAVRTATRQNLRKLLNELRNELRRDTPAQRGRRRLQRGWRVRAVRGIAPGAITMELVTPVFYGRLTNIRGRTTGWFDRAAPETEIENRLRRDVGLPAARGLSQVLLAAFRRRAIEDLARTARATGAFAVNVLAAGARGVISTATR